LSLKRPTPTQIAALKKRQAYERAAKVRDQPKDKP
jgi:protein-arginine kinase activator protein McsA